MEQQTSHWITIAVVFAIGLTILLFNLRSDKERRSLGQWAILKFYAAVRFFWAILRGIDVGYLEYRRVLAETPLQAENERVLGKVVKADGAEKESARNWGWDTAAN